MIQLYFLSVLCNGLAGFLLISDEDGSSSDKNMVSTILYNPKYHLVLGILSAVVGVLVLLSPYNGIPILGDLIPSAAGIIAAFAIIFGVYRKDVSSSTDNGKLERFGENLLRFRKALGMGLLAIAALHFLFPQALFL